MKKVFKLLVAVSAFFLLLFIIFWFSTYHPDEIQKENVTCKENPPLLQKGQKVKVLNWNVQYMAGKNYVFFYDEWDGSGPDSRPSKEDIAVTFDEVVRIIKEENPDIILLQEMDDNAKRTDHENQLERLMSILPEDFKCSTSAYYWKAAFVPHPKVMGSVGMQVAVISKYKIDSATRYQLPLMPANFIMQNLNFKRSFIEAVIPVEGGSPLSVMSIHMDAFAQGTDTMQQQVEYVKKTLLDMEAKNQSWLIAGDFNLVPPGKSYDLLPEAEKPMFQKESEISKLYETFNALPKISDVDGPNREKFLTHFPNISKTTDRVLDYYFYSKNIIAEDFYVRQNDTLKISDHLPAIMIFNVK